MDIDPTAPQAAAKERSTKADALPHGAAPKELTGRTGTKPTPSQLALLVLGAIAFLYFARPVVLPIILACVAGITLKPLVRWLSFWHISPAYSAALVLIVLVGGILLCCLQFNRPAMRWVNEAPQRMTELRQRVQQYLPSGAGFSKAAAAVSDLGATEAEKEEELHKAPVVQVKDNRGTNSVLNWTGTFIVGVCETLVLLYLLLASGDLFLQKLVHVMPTLSDKKRAVEISREIQQNISQYLFSVALINLGLGLAVSGGLFYMGVPNSMMWGLLVAVLNFVPYFGPVVGVFALGAVGLLTFDTLGNALLPPVWYLLLHLLEANLITPVLLGRRFTLNPVVIFISLIFWTWLWGVPGALLSVPILVSIKVVSDHLPAMSSISELLGR